MFDARIRAAAIAAALYASGREHAIPKRPRRYLVLWGAGKDRMLLEFFRVLDIKMTVHAYIDRRRRRWYKRYKIVVRDEEALKIIAKWNKKEGRLRRVLLWRYLRVTLYVYGLARVRNWRFFFKDDKLKKLAISVKRLRREIKQRIPGLPFRVPPPWRFHEDTILRRFVTGERRRYYYTILLAMVEDVLFSEGVEAAIAHCNWKKVLRNFSVCKKLRSNPEYWKRKFEEAWWEI